MLILNLFIAMLLNAADEISKIEETAVDRYEIKKIQQLWVKYDKNGKGIINYKDFPKILTEICLSFGIKKHILNGNRIHKNIMKMLKVRIYEHKKTKVFCYEYYSSLIGFAKLAVAIKYGKIKLIFNILTLK